MKMRAAQVEAAQQRARGREERQAARGESLGAVPRARAQTQKAPLRPSGDSLKAPADAARGRHDEQRRVRGRREDDLPALEPDAAASIAGRRDRQWRSAARGDPAELAVGEKADRTAVR